MAASGAGRAAQVAAIAIIAALLAFHVVRGAAVADREAVPDVAASLWPSHPSLLSESAFLSVAKAAASGREVTEGTRAKVRRVAVQAPLSPDPFLIEGAVAETEKRPAAEPLFLAARNRDPRSRGARFLLADRYLRTGRITDALVEIQALVILQAGSAEVFVPALVNYARTPGAVPELRAFFKRRPALEPAVLSLLAADPANADLVLSLATVSRPDPDWRGTLVSALATAGQYQKAHATWVRLSGVRPSPGLFNPGFAEHDAPPPFNWAFPQTPEGVAEPDGKGGASLLYYGRARAVLASQMMVLPPGSYRLTVQVAANSGEAGAIHWALRCANADRNIADVPLQAGNAAATLGVPGDCPAQWIEFVGIPGDVPRTTELTISGLRLSKAGQ
jgi:hypothetical protein